MNNMLRIFIGGDPRQVISYTVLQHSIITNASKPVQITPLMLNQLPVSRIGLTPFTFTRFLVPWLCDYKGWALFMDADMILLDDIAKLFDLADEKYAVMVVKNKIRYEWASVMLFNCEKCKILTPDFVNTIENRKSHEINWVEDDLIGALPDQWNHLVGYDDEKKDVSLVHFTQGNPMFPETSRCEYSKEWLENYNGANSHLSWEEIMGTSSHATKHHGRLMPKLRVLNRNHSGFFKTKNVGVLDNIYAKTYEKKAEWVVFNPSNIKYRSGIFGVKQYFTSVINILRKH